MEKKSKIMQARDFLTKKIEGLKEIRNRNDRGDKNTADMLEKKYQGELDALTAYVEEQRPGIEAAQAPQQEGAPMSADGQAQQQVAGNFAQGGSPDFNEGTGAFMGEVGGAQGAQGGNFDINKANGFLDMANMFGSAMTQQPAPVSYKDGGNLPKYGGGGGVRRPFAMQRAEQYVPEQYYPDNAQGEALYNVGSNIYANPNSPYSQDYFDQINRGGRGALVGNTDLSNIQGTQDSMNYDPLSNATYRPTDFVPGESPTNRAASNLNNTIDATDPGNNMVPYEEPSAQNKMAVGEMSETEVNPNRTQGQGKTQDRNFSGSDAARLGVGLAPILSNYLSSKETPEWVKTAKDPYQARKDWMNAQQMSDAYSRPIVDQRPFYQGITKATNRAIAASPTQGSAQYARLGTANILKQAAAGYGQGSQQELAEGARQKMYKDSQKNDLYGKYAREGSYMQQLKMAEDDRQMAAEANARNFGRKATEQGFNFANTELERGEQQKLLQDLYANYEMKGGKWVYKGDQTA